MRLSKDDVGRRVEYTGYAEAVGLLFGEHFRIVSVDDDCATIDDGDGYVWRVRHESLSAIEPHFYPSGVPYQCLCDACWPTAEESAKRRLAVRS